MNKRQKKKTPPKKTATTVSSSRVVADIQQRFNPLPNLTPELCASYHAAFRRGDLRGAAMMWEQMESVDDQLKTVAPKRKKAISRLGFEVITVDDSPEAKKHAETLEQFYNNIQCTNAVDENERGGFPLLVRQMMDSIGKKYAVHEIVWQPGQVFSAQFRFVPLWFFENRTGRLRFLENAHGIEGVEMNPGEWLVTTGDGVMFASAACYMFKHLPLGDWLIVSERYGQPVVVGKSEGKPGDDVWNSMEDAIAGIAGGEEVVVSQGSEIDVHNFNMGSGNLPQPALIERMDRSMAALWRGGDLSTMSKGDAVGANMQDDEKDLLENDDAGNITDVLNEQVDKFVIRYVHGDLVPKAWIRLKTNIRQDVELDLKIDESLEQQGYEEPIEEKQKRYNRPHLQKKAATQPTETEAANTYSYSQPGALMATRHQQIKLPGWLSWIIGAANTAEPVAKDPSEELLQNARSVIATAMQEDLQPVVASLADLLDTTADEDLAAALDNWRTNELPALAKEALTDPKAAEAWENTLGAALINGYSEPKN
jgi:phage gp29-like protein